MPRPRRTDFEKAAAKRKNDLCFIGMAIKSSCELRHGSVQAAADAIGIGKSHLYDLIRRPERLTVDELWKLSPILPAQTKAVLASTILP